MTCAGYFAHPFEFPLIGDAQRKQPENHCKTQWTSEVASTGICVIAEEKIANPIPTKN